MKWFRTYHDFIDDPKLLRQPIENRWYYFCLLAVASRQIERGTLPDITTIGIHLRISTEQANELVNEFIRCGFIDATQEGQRLSIHGWDKRQFSSDNVTERVKKHQKQKKHDKRLVERSDKQDDVVPQNGELGFMQTFPDTDTENEKKREKKRSKQAEFVLPEWVPADLWEGFMETRQKKRNLPTELAKQILIKKLDGFRKAGHNITTIMETAIAHGWLSFFAPGDRPQNSESKPDPPITYHTARKLPQ